MILFTLKVTEGTMKLRNDLTGQKFNRLLVLNPIFPRKEGKHLYYKCLCDCGKESNVNGSKLKNNHTRSCGCLHNDTRKDHRKLEKGIANRNALINSYKGNAKVKKLEFNLSNEEMISIFESNCYYCNRPPYCIFERKNTNGAYIFTGIDRMNPSKGYSIENVVPCCTQCNYNKRDMNFEDFLKWIEVVYLNVKPKFLLHH